MSQSNKLPSNFRHINRSYRIPSTGLSPVTRLYLEVIDMVGHPSVFPIDFDVSRHYTASNVSLVPCPGVQNLMSIDGIPFRSLDHSSAELFIEVDFLNSNYIYKATAVRIGSLAQQRLSSLDSMTVVDGIAQRCKIIGYLCSGLSDIPELPAHDVSYSKWKPPLFAPAPALHDPTDPKNHELAVLAGYLSVNAMSIPDAEKWTALQAYVDGYMACAATLTDGDN